MTAEGSHAIISAGDPLLQDRERSFAIASTISGKRYVNQPGELSEPNPLGLLPRDNSEAVFLDLHQATPARRPALHMWEGMAGSQSGNEGEFRIKMDSINEELQAAKAVKTAINTLSITTPKSDILGTLRAANLATIRNLGKGGDLNEARINVGIALSNLINGSPTRERIDKAQCAINSWITELEAAKP